MKFPIGLFLLVLVALTGCGRTASSLLRSGQLPLNDFPLYLTDSQTGGSAGVIYQYERDGTQTIFASGLNEPQGLTTDRFGNLYVVEAAAGRVLKYKTATGEVSVVATGLQSPSVIAADSVGETYVAQDTPHNIIRVKDGKVMASFYSQPTALTIGVNDLFIVGDAGVGKVFWGLSATSPAADFNIPVSAAIDQMGRVYVAEGLGASAKLYRYQQTSPGTGVKIVEDLRTPTGIAVDPVGNVFVVEVGRQRISLISYDGQMSNWSSAGLIDPRYLAFTQY